MRGDLLNLHICPRLLTTRLASPPSHFLHAAGRGLKVTSLVHDVPPAVLLAQERSRSSSAPARCVTCNTDVDGGGGGGVALVRSPSRFAPRRFPVSLELAYPDADARADARAIVIVIGCSYVATRTYQRNRHRDLRFSQVALSGSNLGRLTPRGQSFLLLAKIR